MFRKIVRRTVISNILFVAGYAGGLAVAHVIRVRQS